jgi:hypothetical protein
VALAQRVAFGRNVAIVEAEERRAELGNELEGGVDLEFGEFERVLARREPRAIEGALNIRCGGRSCAEATATRGPTTPAEPTRSGS